MSASQSQRQHSDPLRLPDTFGAAALKAGIDSELSGIGSVVFDALVAHYGTVKALGFELGEVDPSQARAELKACDFRRFVKHAKADARAVFADAIDAACGTLRNADDDADQCVAQIFVLAQRLAKYIAYRRTEPCR